MDNPTETQTPTTFGSKLKSFRHYSKVIIAILLIASFGLGYLFGFGRLKVNNKLQIIKGNPPASQTADYSLLWDALDELNSKYVDKPIDQQKVLYGAISGAVAAVGDPYTTFFDPTAAKQFSDQLAGTFDGIGAEVGSKNNQIVIIAPLDNTPAQKAGLAAGDAILGIDGKDTSTMTVDDAVNLIRGTAGTTVTLTILHQNAKTAQDVKITRSHITVNSVTMTDKQDGSKKIADITVSEFGDDTKGLFEQDVQKVLNGNYQGIIIDLRNDPGGYLDTAVAIASNWIDSGQTVVQEKDADGSVKQYSASGTSPFKSYKTVVLVNGGSASASEILSGALQDYGLATLVGQQTFGKGSVQELTNLKDGSEIKITVAKWLTPKGRGINKVGLTPDDVVTMTADDANAGRDPQMDKALQLLK